MARSKKGPKYGALIYNHITYGWKFNPIKSYLKESQEMISRLNIELEEKYKELEAEYKNDEFSPNPFYAYEMDSIKLGEFEGILYNATFLAIYAAFESAFSGLCLQCKEIGNLNLGPKDINRNGYIDQCRVFLTKVLLVNLDKLDQSWQKLLCYREMRNSFTHKNGAIIKPSKNLIKFIESDNGIEYDEANHKLKITSIDFLIYFIDIVQGYLNQVCDEIRSQKK